MQGKLILDIGCGERPIAEANVTVDVSKDVRPMVVADVRKLPFREEIFDKVYSSHVIEHISWREIDEVLADWVRVLKPFGVFELVCPNLRPIGLRLFLDRYDALRHMHSKDAPHYDVVLLHGSQDYFRGTHLSGFTPKLLKNFLKRHGLCNIKFHRRGDVPIIPYLTSNRYIRWLMRRVKIFPAELYEEIHVVATKRSG